MDAPDLLPTARMQWSDLVYFHWPVDGARMRALLPDGVTLDLYRGQAYVSVVAFHLRIAPPLAMPALALECHEVNVRTYVRFRDQMPGVYFLSLDAESWTAVLGARTLLGLPYRTAHFHRAHHGTTIAMAAARELGGGRFHAELQPGRMLGASRPGSLAHFVLERYALYVDRPLSLFRMQIRHRPIAAQQAHVLALSEDLVAATGLPPTEGPPKLAHYARSVDVDVYRPELVEVNSSSYVSRRAVST